MTFVPSPLKDLRSRAKQEQNTKTDKSHISRSINIFICTRHLQNMAQFTNFLVIHEILDWVIEMGAFGHFDKVTPLKWPHTSSIYIDTSIRVLRL
jgi:hypothetical protein